MAAFTKLQGQDDAKLDADLTDPAFYLNALLDTKMHKISIFLSWSWHIRAWLSLSVGADFSTVINPSCFPFFSLGHLWWVGHIYALTGIVVWGRLQYSFLSKNILLLHCNDCMQLAKHQETKPCGSTPMSPPTKLSKKSRQLPRSRTQSATDFDRLELRRAYLDTYNELRSSRRLARGELVFFRVLQKYIQLYRGEVSCLEIIMVLVTSWVKCKQHGVTVFILPFQWVSTIVTSQMQQSRQSRLWERMRLPCVYPNCQIFILCGSLWIL